MPSTGFEYQDKNDLGIRGKAVLKIYNFSLDFAEIPDCYKSSYCYL